MSLRSGAGMSELLDAITVGVDALSESLADRRAKEADAVIPEVKRIVEECEKRTKRMRKDKERKR